MQERQQMIDRYFVFGEDKFEPHIDYSRTRGLVSEIVNEIDGVENEIKLARAAELEPPPDHVPRAPIGAYRAASREEEETFVIGPDGVESTEVVEPDSAEAIPPEPEEPVAPDGPDEVIEPEEPATSPDADTPVEAPQPANQDAESPAE
ncbi:MAG: hypothetical protein JRD92_03000 [Deltaproteobacteria bacterium]|nr:hypothetical protein [Deltaproteobacteria bacterium]